MILREKEISNLGGNSKDGLQTKCIVIEAGAVKNFEDEIAKLGLRGTKAVVCDTNTYEILKQYPVAYDRIILLKAANLHANENATAEVIAKLGDTEILIAFGTGTIHDITRWCAHKAKLPFVSCPTAASMDGFCSSVSAMTWGGYKNTMAGVAPVLVIADLDIIVKAPKFLTRAGVGDILGKYTALVDWEISSILTGEYFSDRIASITREAVKTMVDSLAGISSDEYSSYENLMYGLILSGIAMQIIGNSRPASGAEHHISHMLELNVLGEIPALHGEKVGVATLLVSDVYHALINRTKEDIKISIKDYRLPSTAEIQSVFGPLTETVIAENTQLKVIKGICQSFIEKYSDIQRIVATVPNSEQLKKMLVGIGAKTTLEDIGIDNDNNCLLLSYSPLIRNRLTLMRLLQYCNLI